MGKIIGIDVGGSTTKIIGFDNNKIFSPMIVKANDPVSSVYGAFGKFLSFNKLALDNIERVMITGDGSSYIKGFTASQQEQLTNSWLLAWEACF